VVRAERAGLFLLVGAAGDGDRLEAHVAGELHPEVAEAADAEHGDEVTGAGTAFAQRVEGGDARAQQRAGIHIF